jgi:hypothetical protein
LPVTATSLGELADILNGLGGVSVQSIDPVRNLEVDDGRSAVSVGIPPRTRRTTALTARPASSLEPRMNSSMRPPTTEWQHRITVTYVTQPRPNGIDVSSASTPSAQ